MNILRSLLFITLLGMGLSTYANEGDVITVAFNGNQASVNIPATAAVTYEANGAYVTLNSSTEGEEYIYRITGTTNNGGLVINGAYKLTLQLAGVNITSNQGAAIDVQCGKRIGVELVEGTVNTLKDCAEGTQKAAFYIKGHAEFEGEGTLNVTGLTKHAISAKEYLQLKKTTGTINILGAVSDGIHCGKGKENNEHRYFQMSGGIVNISGVGSDGIDSDDYGIMNIKGGVININVATEDGCGLKCDSILYMTGGDINIDVTGTDAEGFRANYEARLNGGNINISVSGAGAKGIRGKNSTDGLVKNGGYLSFKGSEVSIYLHTSDIFAADGSISTHCRAITADTNITYDSGNINVYAYGNIRKAIHTDGEENNTDGNLTLRKAPWSFYYADFKNDMTAYVRVKVNDELINASGYAIGAFIDNQCVGIAEDGYLRIYSNSENASSVTFKAYNLATDEEINLSSASPVTFTANASISTATAPLLLEGSATTEEQATFERPQKQDVFNIIHTVNRTWQRRHPTHGDFFWNRATYYIGNMHAYEVTQSKDYRDYATAWAERNNWRGREGSEDPTEWRFDYGESYNYVLFGDNQVCFQVYADLYNLDPDKDPQKIARAREVMEYEISTDEEGYLWWVDGLFMVMPIMTKLYNITGNQLYLDKMYTYWKWYTDQMFDQEEDLYYRDASYVYPQHTTLAGKKDFWARGDGWIFAAFAKILQDLPETDAHREEYISYFRRMAAALKRCQQPEGYWERSLIDPDQAPGYETSGTAFFAYGFAWGIRTGILEEAKYGDVLTRAWQYLSTIALQNDGTVGYIQPIGSKAIPGQIVGTSDYHDFGVGAFLMAASEISKLAVGEVTELTPQSVNSISQSTDGTSIAVSFNLPVNRQDALNAGSYTIDGRAYTGYITVSNDNYEAYLTLPTGLKEGLHQLEVANIRSSEGGLMASSFVDRFYVPVALDEPESDITITTSGAEIGNPAQNAYDGDLSTRWSQEGIGEWLRLDLGKEMKVTAVDIAFYKGSTRTFNFSLQVSTDGVNFNDVLSNAVSNGLTNGLERFTFDTPVIARYVRYVGAGNTVNLWNSVTEIRVRGNAVSRKVANMHFSEGQPITADDIGICTYAKDINKTSDGQPGGTVAWTQPVQGWTATTTGDGCAGGLFEYGTTPWLGTQGYLPPAEGPEGSFSNHAIGLLAVWTFAVQYVQDIILEPGTYTLTVPLYHTSIEGKSNRYPPLKSLIGFITDAGQQYLAPATAYPLNEWSTETVSFTLDETTSGQLSIGYVAPNNGSDNMPHWFIDRVILTKEGSDKPLSVSKAFSPSHSSVYWDLTGRRIAHPRRGLYIVNGQVKAIR